MNIKAYQKAKKEGHRAYSEAVQNNREPYLPVLEEKVPNLSQLSRVSLGILNVPMEFVAGSVSQGRSYAFASNFMPLLEANTEFAYKWASLYESVVENGVNDPPKMLEYMGLYYLIEGNKRVSVMKSMGADSIEADVTRCLPEHNGSPEMTAYYEYCRFSKESNVYDLQLSRPGGYARLVKIPGVRSGDRWTEEESLSLKKIFSYFRVSYHTVMKDKSVMKVGDAFLKYLLAFGYLEVRDDDMKKTEDRIRLMQQEFVTGAESMNLIMDQQETPQAPLLAGLFRPSRLKAAFLYNREIGLSAWNYWHDLGRMEAEEKMEGRLETRNCVVPSRTDFSEEIAALIRDGYTAFFATSPVMLNSCLQPALEHPEVRVLCCSMLSGSPHIRTYYLRFYEAKFLLGLAAGILARNGKIGYIGDFPTYSAASAANAFALGVRMTNPEARVYLKWFSTLDFCEDDPFGDPEITVICNRDITAPNRESRDYGLYVRENGEIRSMATLIPHWGLFYHAMSEQLLNGSFDGLEDKNSPQNYWLGMSSDALDVVFSNRFDAHAGRLIRYFKEGLRDYSIAPFEGELHDQNGNLRCAADASLTPAEIICMDYLTDNIIGSFPETGQLITTARPLVNLQGVYGERKPDASAISWIKM